MTILTVDDHPESLEQLSRYARTFMPDAEFLSYESSMEALAAAREKEIDIAFLRAQLPELTGLDLGQYIKELYPMVNLIFLSENEDPCCEAMALHASGFLKGKATKEGVRYELTDLRYPERQKKQKRVFAQTFGNFEFFVDGVPVNFKYSRTKELVALLINNRGSQTSNGEIIATLWEDDGDPEKKSSYLGNLRQDLQNTMNRLKLQGVLLKQRGSLAIAANQIECDLYDWLEKKRESKYQYLGDYMTQYSWAEYMHAELDEISYALDEEDF